MHAISVDDLQKVYRVNERSGGMAASLKSLFKRSFREVKAVDHIGFSVQPGEIVGFLGPNGAGKTTTLKMLSGLLYPSGGKLSVLGYEPYQRQADFLKQITLVMGQRNQLIWDIPAQDTYLLIKTLYRIPEDQFTKTLDELIELLDLSSLLQKPVRNLSLGERMKCEIAGALLHRPQVLFLDEPTLGLDITAQRRIREFVLEYNLRHNATVLLTSHYMADVEALAERVVVIHHGRILFDGKLAALIHRFSPHKTISVVLEKEVTTDLVRYGEIVEIEGLRFVIRVPKEDTARATGRLLAELPVHDLTVDDPDIEEAIEAAFAQPEKSEGSQP